MKHKNQIKLLEPIQKLSCLHIENKVSLLFDIYGGIDIMGAAAGNQIKLYACSIVNHVDAVKFDINTDIGDYAVKVLAHEFRHVQQLNFQDLPQVYNEHRRKHMGIKPDGWTQDGYLSDPGELDARDFADYMVKALKPSYKKKLARLIKWVHRKQYNDWYSFRFNYCVE